MKVRRPEAVDPLTWERLPRGVRLALASHYARTPERQAALRRAAFEHSERQLRRALAILEGAAAPSGDHDEQ